MALRFLISLWALRAMPARTAGFMTKTDKTPPKELALARKRMKEWKNVDT